MERVMAATIEGQASDSGSWASSSLLVLVMVMKCFKMTQLRYLIIRKFKFLSISLEAAEIA